MWVIDDGARHADVGALLPQHPGGAVDRRWPTRCSGRGDDEQGGVRGPQAGPQFTDEIGVPGGVDQIDPDRAGRAAAGSAAGEVPAPPVLATASDTDRPTRRSTSSKSQTVVPFSMLPGPADGAGRGEDRLDQHGLSGAAGADQDHVANLFGGSVSGRLTGALGHAGRPARVEARWLTTDRPVVTAANFGMPHRRHLWSSAAIAATVAAAVSAGMALASMQAVC